MRRWIKFTCVHVWRERHLCGRVHCYNCHDRYHGGTWLFKSLGLPR